MLTYSLQARRIDAHGSTVSAKEAVLQVDTDPQGRTDALAASRR